MTRPLVSGASGPSKPYVHSQTASLDAASRIVNATERLLRTRGYSGLTMSEIAQEAELSRPTVYRYFPDKEAILWTLTERAGAHIFRVMAEAISESASPVEQLRALVRNHALTLIEHRVVFRLALRTNLELSADRQRELAEAQRRYLQFTQNVISSGVAQGFFRDLPKAIAAEAVLAVSNSVLDWYRDEGPWSREVVVNELANVALFGLTPIVSAPEPE